MSKNKLAEEKYDTMSLNAICFDRRAPIEKRIPSKIKVHGMWYYSGCMFYAIIRECFKILLRFPIKQWFANWNYYKQIYDNNIVFVVPTWNNQQALKKTINFVKERRQNVVVLDNIGFYKSIPRIYVLFYSIIKLGSLLRSISDLSAEDKRIVGYYPDVFLLASGTTKCYSKLLKRFRPECMVIGNDHVYDRKALTLLCEDYGINTVYCQHASVSYAFPELHFAYSFLDGRDSFEKYTAEGKKCAGKVILLGALRYDKLSEYRVRRKSGKRNCIGISINLIDDIDIVNELCLRLLEDMNVDIKIRSHPSMKKRPNNLIIDDRLVYLCATDESMIDYLDSIDIQISGDSGVHLDALIGGTPTLAYNFTTGVFGDNYKYVERGLVRYALNCNEVINLIHSIDITSNVSSIRYYDESYGKSYAGHCSEIVASFVVSGCNFNGLMDENHFEGKAINGSLCYVVRD